MDSAARTDQPRAAIAIATASDAFAVRRKRLSCRYNVARVRRGSTIAELAPEPQAPGLQVREPEPAPLERGPGPAPQEPGPLGLEPGPLGLEPGPELASQEPEPLELEQGPELQVPVPQVQVQVPVPQVQVQVPVPQEPGPVPQEQGPEPQEPGPELASQEPGPQVLGPEPELPEPGSQARGPLLLASPLRWPSVLRLAPRLLRAWLPQRALPAARPRW